MWISQPISSERTMLYIRLGIVALCCGMALPWSACSSKPSAPPKPEAAALWGEMKPVVSVKELMRDMIDPASDYIFDAISTTVERGGVKERLPETDEDWEKIQIGAVAMAEAS